MTGDISYWEVHFNDEAPAFGAGKRRVLLVQRGPKWSKLLSPEDCQTETMLTIEFERLKPKELLLPAWNYQEMAVRLERLAKEFNRNSALYRDAMKELGFPVPEPEPGMSIANDGTHREKKTTPVKAKVEYSPGVGEKPGPGEGSGKLMQRLWMTGSYTPEQLVAIVLTNWPGRTTKKSDVKYNYNILMEMPAAQRLVFFGREDVPIWPEKETIKATVIKPAPTPERTKPAAKTRGLKSLMKDDPK